MKKHILKFTISAFIFILFSCVPDNEKFSGSPVGNLTFENITGVVTTTTDFALPGQEIDFTATLPADFRSKVTGKVTVEATTLNSVGSRRRAYVDILPGQNTATGKISVGGVGQFGSVFETQFTLKLTAINLETVVEGKQFTLDSNELIINSGSTSVDSEDDKKMQIKVSWENTTTPNKINCRVLRVNSTAVSLRGTTTAAKIKINGIDYTAPLNTDLVAWANTFVTNNESAIQSANPGMTLQAIGKSILFNYTTPLTSAITVAPASTSNFSFSDVTFLLGNAGVSSNGFQFLNTQPKTGLLEGQTNAFNPGTYKIVLDGAGSTLSASTLDLKYRVVIRMPNGEVKIYNGLYPAMSLTSGKKEVLQFTKNGIGTASEYVDFINLNP